MNESMAVNYDIEKCTILYERAMARQSSSVSMEDTIVCENPAGPDRRTSFDFEYRNSRKLSRQLLRHKMSIQTQISLHEQDEEEKEELSRVKEAESITSSFEDIIRKQHNTKMGEIKSWYSEI